MKHEMFLYILVMTAVTFAIRLLPLTLLRRPIRNRFLRSFLYYVPYVTLAVMTFPAIVEATQAQRPFSRASPSPGMGRVSFGFLRHAASSYSSWNLSSYEESPRVQIEVSVTFCKSLDCHAMTH